MKKFADIVAVIGAMIGSALIACNCGYNQIGYIAFCISAVATIYLLKLCNGSWSLKFVAYFYFAMDIIGVVNYGN
jgi:hypothetical protein